MTCKSINKKVQLHPHALPPSHLPHSFVGPASFIANVGAAAAVALYPLPGSLLISFFFWVMFHVSPLVFCYFVGLSVRRFTENYI